MRLMTAALVMLALPICHQAIAAGAEGQVSYAAPTPGFDIRPVEVEAQQVQLWDLAAYPNILVLGQRYSVVFRVSISGPDNLSVRSVELEQIDESGTQVLRRVGAMNDDGRDGDHNAGDFMFARIHTVTAATSDPLYFRAVAQVDGAEPLISGAQILFPSRFTAPSGPSSGLIITSPDGAEILDNELIVSFAQTVNEDDVEDLAALIDADAVKILFYGTYLFRFEGDGTYETLLGKAATLAADPRVSAVEPNGIARINDGNLTIGN